MDQKTRRALQSLEESLWRGETRFNDDLMGVTFADDFFEFGRSGRTYTRDQMMLGHMAGSPIHARLPLHNFAARLLSDDLAQVTYVSEVRYPSGVEYANRSSIWSREKRGWCIRFHQGTPGLAPGA